MMGTDNLSSERKEKKEKKKERKEKRPLPEIQMRLFYMWSSLKIDLKNIAKNKYPKIIFFIHLCYSFNDIFLIH